MPRGIECQAECPWLGFSPGVDQEEEEAPGRGRLVFLGPQGRPLCGIGKGEAERVLEWSKRALCILRQVPLPGQLPPDCSMSAHSESLVTEQGAFLPKHHSRASSTTFWARGGGGGDGVRQPGWHANGRGVLAVGRTHLCHSGKAAVPVGAKRHLCSCCRSACRQGPCRQAEKAPRWPPALPPPQGPLHPLSAAYCGDGGGEAQAPETGASNVGRGRQPPNTPQTAGALPAGEGSVSHWGRAGGGSLTCPSPCVLLGPASPSPPPGRAFRRGSRGSSRRPRGAVGSLARGQPGAGEARRGGWVVALTELRSASRRGTHSRGRGRARASVSASARFRQRAPQAPCMVVVVVRPPSSPALGGPPQFSSL